VSLHDALLPFDEVLAALPGVQGLANGQNVLDLAWLGHAWCEDLVVSSAEPDGRQLYARLILQRPNDLPLADLGLVNLTIPQSGGLIESVVRLRTGSRPQIAADVPLTVVVRQPFLRPVDLQTGAAIGEGLELQVRASIAVNPAGPRVHFHAVSVPPTMIGATGIIVALDDVQLLLDDADLPDVLRPLAGAGPTRLLAERAVLRWLPQFVSALADLRGITMPLQDVVVDDSGVSFTVDWSWQVRQDAAGRISPRSQAFGSLLGGHFRAALSRVIAEVVRSQPSRFDVQGLVEIPWLPGAADVTFSWNGAPEENGGNVDLSVQHPGVQLTLGSGHLNLAQMELSGSLGDDRLSVGGSARVTLALPGVAVGPVGAEFEFEATGERHHLSAALDDVPIGPLGRVNRATLAFDLVPVADAWSAESAVLSADMRWSDVRSQLTIAHWPASIPQPPDSARVVAELRWDDPALDLTFRVETDASADLWTFLPAGYRPVTRRLELGVRVHFADAAAFGAAAPGSALQAEVVLLVEFRPLLPAMLQDNRLIELSVPDTEGFVTARAAIVTGGSGGDRVEFSIDDVLGLDVFVPFLQAERPIVHAEARHLGMQLVAGAGGAPDRMILEASGTIRLRHPRLASDDPLGRALNAFLTPLGDQGLTGTLTARLETDGTSANTTFELKANITETRLDIDLLALIGAMAPPQDTNGTTVAFRGEVPLDTSVRFSLDGFTLRISPPAAAGGSSVVSAEVSVTAEVGGASISAVVAVSTENLSLGFSAEIPLRVPRFPVAPADLARLATGSGQEWTQTGFVNEAQALATELIALDAPAANEATRREQRRRRAELAARGEMLAFLERKWAPLDAPGRRTFQQLVEPFVAALDSALGFTHVDSNLVLRVDRARLLVPWRAPQEIALEGGASLHGFAPDDPFRGLEGLTLGLGISPDQVYFSLEGSGEPVPLPDFGRYPGGSVSLSRLSIGYGFTKNSLAIAFAGAIRMPPQLVEDADLSDDVGFGVRLPSNSSLAFRLDVIPVPGPIPVVPSGEFALDLRTPGLPGIANIAGCTPVWDGLQLHVPGVVHMSFKQAAVSPLFGILPALNARFDGDLDLGNEETGVTVVCDDLLWLAGIGTPPNILQVPLLFDPTAPFFENFCVNVRFLGFRLNLAMQRPFPQPNPLVVFELMALLADPDQPVDPDGPLANMVRVAVRDASLSIPEWLQLMVPGSRRALRNSIAFELDLGTVITVLQWLAEAARQAADLAGAALDSGEDALRTLTAGPPPIGELLDVIPEPFRVVEADFDFAGFKGRGAIALTSVRNVLAAGSSRPTSPRPSPGRVDWPSRLRATRLRVPRLADRFGALRPFVPPATVVTGPRPSVPPFDAFEEADFEALPLPPAGADGVLIAAEMTLFEIARFSTVGYACDTGHFAVVSTAATRDGRLRIANIDVPLPLKLKGRATLEGRVAPNHLHAALSIAAVANWEPLPGIARLTLGSDARPVDVMLSTDGRFRIRGDARAELFAGALDISGSVDASEAHLRVSGDLALSIPRAGSSQPWVRIDAEGALAIGPGQHFRFEGGGGLRVLGRKIANASLTVGDDELALSADVNTTRLNVAGIRTRVRASISGRAIVNEEGLRRLDLNGQGRIAAAGATIQGRVGLSVRPSRITVSASGEMRWFGQTWLAASGSVSTDGAVRLIGRTAVAISVLPDSLPGGIQLARLFVRLDVRGNVELDPDRNLGVYTFDLEWSVGVRLPGAQGHMFVLAMQKLHTEGEGTLDRTLLTVNRITFVPGGDVQIPIPTLTASDYRKLHRVWLDVPVIDVLRFVATQGMINTMEDIVGSDLVGSEELFSVPTKFSLGTEMMTLEELSRALAFSVAFVWRERGPAFAVRRGNEETLIFFDEIV
jgi:hypothetical protein